MTNRMMAGNTELCERIFLYVHTNGSDRFDHGAEGIDLFVQSEIQGDMLVYSLSNQRLKHIERAGTQVAVTTHCVC